MSSVQKVASKANVNGSPKSSTLISATSSGILYSSEDEDGTKPDFIYGGPFIKVEKPSVFLDTATPINLQLQGTFKKYVLLLLTNCFIFLISCTLGKKDWSFFISFWLGIV